MKYPPSAWAPSVAGIDSPREWLSRQRLNARIGIEYLRYRRMLGDEHLGRYRFTGPEANAHVRAVVPVPPDRPLRIFAFWKQHNWENYNLLPALESFGAVLHYDPTEDYDPAFDGLPDARARARMQERVWTLVTKGQDGAPWDVLYFYTSGAYFEPTFVERLAGLGIPMVNFGHDDIVYFEDRRDGGVIRGNAEIARHFTVYCCTSVIGFHKALATGATPYYMPGGANEEVYRKIEGCPRDLDVVLVGARFYDRPQTVDFLQRNGVRVEAYGAGWPNGPVSNEEQIRLLNRARIVLGFNRLSGSDWMGIKGRDHEVPMSGAFHLVNDFDELRNVYVPGKEVGVYRSGHELLANVRQYLADHDARERIAAAGHARARRDHTWRRRFADLFERLGLLPAATRPPQRGVQAP